MLKPCTPAASIAGVATSSASATTTTATRNSDIIAAKIAQPCRRLPTIRPYVDVSAAGIARISSISTKLESHVGFSNGCAELTLKKPPPFVPSCLITSWEPTGPARQGLDHALGHEEQAEQTEIGSST